MYVARPAVIRELDASAAAALPKMRGSRCAVVGNGGTLANASFGAEIDAHDRVIRVNQGPTRGYERHVGAKTHIRVLNHKWSKEYRLSKKLRLGSGGDVGDASDDDEHRVPVNVVLSRVSAFEFAAFAKRFMHKAADVSLLASPFVAHAHTLLMCVRQRAARLNIPPRELERWGKGTAPSTGMLAVLMMLRHCDHVSVYGIGRWTCPSPRSASTNGTRNVFPGTPRACTFHMPHFGRREMHEGETYHYFTRGAGTRVQDSTKLRPFAHHSFPLEADVLALLYGGGSFGVESLQ